MKEILEAGERTEAGVTAPPQGLVLVEIQDMVMKMKMNNV